jgi:prolyl-tRNA editing enzyme YbaK/EbsC (Cys-tRNA(Pro) deacylase)
MAVDFARFGGVLRELGVSGEVVELPERAPTAASAAAQLGCDVGAIANSLVFSADASSVRAWTGQPIGGVGPVGHPAPIRTLVDIWLDKYDVIWAAAGHPHTVFPTSYAELIRITGGIPADVGE